MIEGDEGGSVAEITRRDRGGPATSTALQLDLEATNEFVVFTKAH